MTLQAPFPAHPDGRIYLTEGGTETEIMFKHGFELPEFGVYPLLDDGAAVNRLKEIIREILDAAAAHRMPVLLGGFDYRASPDWAKKLGYSLSELEAANLACIDILRELARDYADDIPERRIAGLIGPRGDAYGTGGDITADAAEDYHSVQLQTLKKAGVDLAEAMTFNNIPEAVGLARAAREIGVPLAILFTVDATGRLKSGPSLREAVETVDAETDRAPLFYGINCSHPEEFAPAIEPGAWFGRVRAIRPNAARMEKVALCKLGHLEEGDPEELGRQMGELARAHPHLDVLGGCCGTGGRHAREIARNVLAARREAAPA